MAVLTYNENMFTNVNKINNDGTSNGILVASKLNQKNGQGYKLLDAIDIDWNGAWVSSFHTYIHTTEDLINLFDIGNTTADIQNLYRLLALLDGRVSYIENDYVTNELLYEITQSYQSALHPGNNIIIDEENNIFTYDLVNNDELYNILLSYVTTSDFYEYKQYIQEMYYTKIDTRNEISRQIAYVVNGADEAFDTIKELSDWILSQTEYIPVEYDEIIFDDKKEPTDEETEYDPTKPNLIEAKHEYYHWVEDTTDGMYTGDGEDGGYRLVTSEYIKEHPDEQYYIMRNTASNLLELTNDVENIKTIIGKPTYNELGELVYTGILGRLDTHDSQISDLYGRTNIALERAEAAYVMGYDAHLIAEHALDVAYETKEEVKEATEFAHKAYDLATLSYNVSAYTLDFIGTATQENVFVKASDEDLELAKDGFIDVFTYVYNEETEEFEYIPTTYDPESEDIYYVFYESYPATGLIARFEEDERILKEHDERITENSKLLYKLKVDNSDSSYVTLSLNPTSLYEYSELTTLESEDAKNGFIKIYKKVYNDITDTFAYVETQWDDNYTEPYYTMAQNSLSRTIKIETTYSMFDRETGIIHQAGLTDTQGVLDIFAYASSWLILDNYVEHIVNPLDYERDGFKLADNQLIQDFIDNPGMLELFEYDVENDEFNFATEIREGYYYFYYAG